MSSKIKKIVLPDTMSVLDVVLKGKCTPTFHLCPALWNTQAVPQIAQRLRAVHLAQLVAKLRMGLGRKDTKPKGLHPWVRRAVGSFPLHDTKVLSV